MVGLKQQSRPLSIYIHVPFCDWKCTYCDFNSYAGIDDLIPSFVESLLGEIDLWTASAKGIAYRSAEGAGVLLSEERPSSGEETPAPSGFALADRTIPTIFFGGGTPSLLPVGDIELILARLREHFVVAADTEITMEANPGTVDAEKLRGCRAAGINRLSIGVQSLQEDELRFLTRIHDADSARRAYRDARAAGFDNINLDFIFGLPGQTLESWRRTLDEAVEMRPEHLSLYILTVEENTPLGHDVSRGLVHEADPDAVAALYEWTCEHMSSAGYKQYEISNWSLPGRPCRHNLNYWHNGDYLGLGPGAHSHLMSSGARKGRGREPETCSGPSGVRFAVVRSPQRYIKQVADSESPTFPFSFHKQVEEQTLMQEMADTAWLALRLNEGLNVREFDARFGINFADSFADVALPFVQQGLLERVDGCLRLTDRGRLLSNEVFAAFVGDRP
jgi:oxygen-independent coproporphyrinogen III oxidase